MTKTVTNLFAKSCFVLSNICLKEKIKRVCAFKFNSQICIISVMNRLLNSRTRVLESATGVRLCLLVIYVFLIVKANYYYYYYYYYYYKQTSNFLRLICLIKKMKKRKSRSKSFISCLFEIFINFANVC